MVCMVFSAIYAFSGTGRAILLRHLRPGGCEVGIGAALHDGPVLVDDGDLQAGEPQAGLDRDRWTWDTVQRAAMVSPG
jgi:hypothetical protein